MNDNVTNLFSRDDVTGLGSIDAQAVIRGAKRRRLPMQLATGGALVLALGGLGLTVQGVLGAQDQVATLSQSDGGAREEIAPESDTGALAYDDGIPADRLNVCAQPLTEVAPSASGLVLTTDFPDSPTGTAPIEGTVTLTNNGDEALRGYTAANPAITLSQDGTVVWHSNGAMIMSAAEIALAPGETYVYTTSFTPVVCGEDDEGDTGFREDLPAAPAGEYEVSAAIDFMGDVDQLVTGPLETIELR